MYDVAVIGCGIVGAATAYELAKYRISSVILERENDIAAGTTKANSAIIHAGYDPRPGSLMAKLNVEGAQLAKELCRKLDVPYRQNGSMVLAFSEEELPILRHLLENGIKNGVPGLELLSAEQTRQIEPHLSDAVAGALYAPSAGIVSPWEYALALAETAVRNGVQLFRNCAVRHIRKIPGGYHIKTSHGAYQARFVINAAGIYAAAIHNMVAPPAFTIEPVRGQYYLLDKTEGSRVSHVIFQCPTKDGKGVLVSPTVHGNLIVGPDSEPVTGENVATTAKGLAFVAEMAQKSVPSLNLRESIRNFAGVRASSPECDDFIIQEADGAPGFIDLAGIKSPGLSAAPAIAKMAVELLQSAGLSDKKNPGFVATRTKIRWKELSLAEKRKKIAQNPAYGRVICRCETITEGEILDAVHSPIPPCSIDGVKRRCNAGMGRCQGGFCGPRVLEILSRELHLSPENIQQDKDGTVILTRETKLGGIHHV